MIGLASSGCRRGAAGRPVAFPKAPVILISVDTLRSDHLPDYGYKDVETPAISAFRKDAILFERAYSNVPLTLPAHTSVFTGLSPTLHGVQDNLGYRLDPRKPTLAELLKASGYATGGAVSAVVLSGASGISRGFDFYEDSLEPIELHEALSRVQRSGEESEALLLKWLDTSASGPFFAFLHLYEPHTPYEPKEPFKSRFRSAYDGEIATADAILGHFLSQLKARGLYDKSLIIFFSDHGESLGEHGEDEHGVFLYRASLQVPLLLKLPSAGVPPAFAGSTVRAPVQLTDVFTTIGKTVDLTNFPAHEGSVSLTDLANGATVSARRLVAETFFPRIHFGWSELKSSLDGTWHYIEAPRSELYEMSSDPDELKNRLLEKPDALRSLMAELERHPVRFAAPGAVDPEDAKKLASLGYLSTGASSAGGAPADPKDMVGTVRLLADAVGRLQSGHAAESIVLFEKLLNENPRMFDVWELYSSALVGVGRFDDALAARRRMVGLAPPQSGYALLSVANLCLEIGKPEEAKKHALLAKERGDASADEVLARALLTLGDTAGAETAARAASKSGKTRRRGLLILARIETLHGQPQKALALIDEAATDVSGKRMETAVGLHRLRGDIYARMDRPGEAEKEFLEEIRLFPRNVDVRVELAVLYASQHRAPDVYRTLEALLTDVPTQEAYAKATKTLVVLGDKAGAEAMRRRGLSRFPVEARLKTSS
ncbi:MAG: sulfatase-like hydrolase/transferase [Acidobacteriota bacterium]